MTSAPNRIGFHNPTQNPSINPSINSSINIPTGSSLIQKDSNIFKVLYNHKNKPYYLNTLTMQTQWVKPIQLYKNPQKRHFLNFLAAHVQLDTDWNEFQFRIVSSYNKWSTSHSDLSKDEAISDNSTFDIDKMDISWKRRLFFRYKDLLKEKLHLEKQKEIERIRNLAYSIMENIKPNRFQDVWEELNKEEGLKNVSDQEKVDLYESFVLDKSREKALKENEINKQNKDAFLKLLEEEYEKGTFDFSSVPILKDENKDEIIRSNWKNQSLKHIPAEELFWRNIEAKIKDKQEYKSLEKMDKLELWNLFIVRLTNDQHNFLTKQRQLEYHIHLKNRVSFWQKLLNLFKEGQLNKDSKWEDARLLFENDEETKVLSYQFGPKPINLFQEFVEDLKNDFQQKLLLIRKFFDKSNKSIADFTLESFTEFILQAGDIFTNERFPIQNDKFLQQIYQYLYQEYLEDKKRKENEAFFKLLQKIETIDPETNFEDIIPQIENQEEYTIIGDIAILKSLFNKYTEKLKHKLKRERSIESDSSTPSSKRQKIETTPSLEPESIELLQKLKSQIQ